MVSFSHVFPLVQLQIHLFSEICFTTGAQVTPTVLRPEQRQMGIWAPWPAVGTWASFPDPWDSVCIKSCRVWIQALKTSEWLTLSW